MLAQDIQTLSGINDRLSDFLKTRCDLGSGCADENTFSTIQSMLASARECMPTLKREEPHDPQARAILSKYRQNLLELTKVLATLETWLHCERSRLNSRRERLESAKGWVQAQKQIIVR